MANQILVTTIAMTTFFVSSALGQPSTIHIRLDGSGLVSERTLLGGKAQAGDILKASGLHVVWINPSDPACSDLRLDVVSQVPAGLGGRTMGFTVQTVPNAAAILAPVVKEVAGRLQLSESTLLGVAIAHEIGHLLGIYAHGVEGVMAAELSQVQYLMAAQGSLRFIPAESRRIRERAVEIHRTNCGALAQSKGTR